LNPERYIFLDDTKIDVKIFCGLLVFVYYVAIYDLMSIKQFEIEVLLGYRDRASFTVGHGRDDHCCK
jgi:hypothetical protein